MSVNGEASCPLLGTFQGRDRGPCRVRRQLCLEVNDAGLADDAGVVQWPCHGGDQQQWSLG